MKWLISSLPELEAAIPHIAQHLGPRRKVALYGELGAGKTTFVQVFCRWLGTADRPDSPTFSLVNEYTYRDSDGQLAQVHHIDLYRVEHLTEALDLGIEEMLYDPWYCFIEWPQIIEPILPPEAARLYWTVVSPTERHLLLQ